LTRALVERGILSLSPTIQVHADLQEDFSLLHALSLFAIDTTQKLDPEAPDYALDVLTLIESICENPDAILRRQVDRAKTILMRELKEQGMDFDARIEELDRVEHPKPRADFVYEHFNEFARKHPWLEQDSIHPKSIAREMFENFYSFADYIREYDLERSEGVLLRYLSEVEKALSQTVPDSFKNDELFEIEAFLLTQVREIDSSLLDEWNRLQGLDPRSKEEENQADPKSTPMRSDPMSRPILARIRNEVFSWIRLFSQKNAAEFSVRSIERAIPQGKTWLPPELDAVMKSYFENHSRLRTDTSARAPVHCTIQHQGGSEYSVQQILVDSEEHNDWQFKFRIRLGQVPSEDQVEILEIIDTANSL
jgi:hypothetical protein